MSIKEILEISKDNFSLSYHENGSNILFFTLTDTNNMKCGEILWQGVYILNPRKTGYYKDGDINYIILWKYFEKSLKESPEFKNKFEEYVRPYGVIHLI